MLNGYTEAFYISFLKTTSLSHRRSIHKEYVACTHTRRIHVYTCTAAVLRINWPCLYLGASYYPRVWVNLPSYAHWHNNPSTRARGAAGGLSHSLYLPHYSSTIYTLCKGCALCVQSPFTVEGPDRPHQQQHPYLHLSQKQLQVIVVHNYATPPTRCGEKKKRSQSVRQSVRRVCPKVQTVRTKMALLDSSVYVLGGCYLQWQSHTRSCCCCVCILHTAYTAFFPRARP